MKASNSTSWGGCHHAHGRFAIFPVLARLLLLGFFIYTLVVRRSTMVLENSVAVALQLWLGDRQAWKLAGGPLRVAYQIRCIYTCIEFAYIYFLPSR